MDVYPDFKELLALFNKHGVEYLVVEGYALAFHGAPRFTGASWKQADAGKARGAYGDVPVPFIGRKAFLANKRATGRAKDLADAEALEALNGSETGQE